MGDIYGVAEEVYTLIVGKTDGFPEGSATLIGVLAVLIVDQSQGNSRTCKKLCECLSEELSKAVEKGNAKRRHPDLN